MNEATLNPAENGSWHISGDLIFATVPGLLAQKERLFNGQGKLVIDLAGVDYSDSAGLALILEWLDECRRINRELCVRNAPRSMLDIARVTNVSDILPLAPE